jgi:hypothetical protein
MADIIDIFFVIMICCLTAVVVFIVLMILGSIHDSIRHRNISRSRIKYDRIRSKYFTVRGHPTGVEWTDEDLDFYHKYEKAHFTDRF